MIKDHAWRFARRLALALGLIIAIATPTYAAKWFIDGALGELKPETRITFVQPQPVQLILEFQREGKAVPRAVKEVKPNFLESLKSTGAFSEIVDAPTAKGALLSIIMTNVVDREQLAKLKKKAFGAGLTFGLGSGVVATDYFTIRFEFVPATGKAPIVTTIDHAIHMKFGNTSEAINGQQVRNIKEALNGVIAQAVKKGINTLAADPGFSEFTAVRLPGA
jgi:hypothetical protein